MNDGGLRLWAWLFMGLYIAAMLGFGLLAQRRVRGADDFATARSSYGPFTLAVAFASTTASGATFLGLPGLTWRFGVSPLWIGFIYPLAIYAGVMLCMRAVARHGHAFGSRSIPEYLGDRYNSEAIRLLVAVYSLAMIFFLAAQLVAGLAMFEMMLGLDRIEALVLTTVVMSLYVVLGGAHADILTDTLQGCVMAVIALVIAWLFWRGAGVEGGFAGMLELLRAEGGDYLAPMNPALPLVGSVWALLAMVIAYAPFGFLPHLGNKIWALREERHSRLFVALAFALALVFPLASLGGLLARAVFGSGDGLFDAGANTVIPALFVEILPAWLAALLGAAVLSAIMSTADGLVISSSQVFANDIYRRSLAPRLHPGQDPAVLDQRVLVISRWASALTMIVAAVLAWLTIDMNILLITWIGIGGLIAAISAPLILGVFWSGATRRGALAGLFTGALGFIVLHAGLLPVVPDNGVLAWLAAQQPNPYACAALGEMLAMAVAITVAWLEGRRVR